MTCPDCQQRREQARATRARRRAAPVPEGVTHGRRYTHIYYGCNCPPCVAAERRYNHNRPRASA